MMYPIYSRFPKVTAAYKIIERYTFRSAVISCKDYQDLYSQVNSFQKEIVSIKPCTSERTDTNQWYRIVYKDKEI